MVQLTVANGWTTLGNLLTVWAIPFAFRETAVSVLEIDDAYNHHAKAIILEIFILGSRL